MAVAWPHGFEIDFVRNPFSGSAAWFLFLNQNSWKNPWHQKNFIVKARFSIYCNLIIRTADLSEDIPIVLYRLKDYNEKFEDFPKKGTKQCYFQETNDKTAENIFQFLFLKSFTNSSDSGLSKEGPSFCFGEFLSFFRLISTYWLWIWKFERLKIRHLEMEIFSLRYNLRIILVVRLINLYAVDLSNIWRH